MIAFLIALAPFIPAVLSIAGFIIKIFGTSEANMKAFQEMVQKNKDTGLITVDTAEKLEQFHKEMMEEYERRNTPKPPLA